MSNFYAGVFVFDPSDDTVLCVSDHNYPEEMKMAGGMSVNTETPEETVRREASEELRTQVLASTLVLVETVPSRDSEHTRYFFLADKILGALEKGATWKVEEKDGVGKVTEKLIARWVPIREFADRLYGKQVPAFGAVLGKLASRSPGFYHKYGDLLESFPEPENLGLE